MLGLWEALEVWGGLPGSKDQRGTPRPGTGSLWPLKPTSLSSSGKLGPFGCLLPSILFQPQSPCASTPTPGLRWHWLWVLVGVGIGAG